MKVTLVRPNYRSHLISPPLGLGYISSYLKKGGHSVTVIDALNHELSNEQVVAQCLDSDIVGIQCLTAFHREASHLSQLLKQRGLSVVIGGPHATVLPEKTLEESHADMVVMGEGEEGMLSAVNAIAEGNCDREILGVVRRGGSVSGRSRLTGSLSDLPWPDWESINPWSYKRAPYGGISKRFPVAPIVTTRGCPFVCSFCASPELWEGKTRYREPEEVLDEVQFLAEKMQIPEIQFVDDNITLNRDHVESICNGLIRRNLRIVWSLPNGVRVDKVDLDLFHLMKSSGCYSVAFGIESASPDIRRIAMKGITQEQIEYAVESAHTAGLLTQGFFVFGLPGETKKTIDDTIDFACALPLDKAQFLLLDLVPGSSLWNAYGNEDLLCKSYRSFQEPVWAPEGLSFAYLEKMQAVAFRRFFMKPRRMLKMIRYIHPTQLKFVLQRLYDFGIFTRL